VDWDQRVVLPRGRLSVAAVEDARVGELRELVDLTSDRPEPRVAPDWARRW
jgi:hypothetical protein